MYFKIDQFIKDNEGGEKLGSKRKESAKGRLYSKECKNLVDQKLNRREKKNNFMDLDTYREMYVLYNKLDVLQEDELPDG